MSTPPPKDLAVLDSEEQELERARRTDFDRDSSQIAQLRALVSEVAQSLRSRKPEGEETMSPPVAEHPNYMQSREREGVISIMTTEAESRAINDPPVSNEKVQATSNGSCRPLATTTGEESSLTEGVGSRLGIMAELLVQVRYSQAEETFNLYAHSVKLYTPRCPELYFTGSSG